MLENQVSAYESILKDLSNAMKEQINATQRDINREFTPVIEQAMVRFQIISHAGLKVWSLGVILHSKRMANSKIRRLHMSNASKNVVSPRLTFRM